MIIGGFQVLRKQAGQGPPIRALDAIESEKAFFAVRGIDPIWAVACIWPEIMINHANVCMRFIFMTL